MVRFYDNGDIQLNIRSVTEAKLAIKELKLRKKEINAEKKEVNARISEIRSAYRQQSTERGSMMRGGGGIGKFARAIQRSTSDASRQNKERAIAPHEQRKLQLDRMIVAIDNAIIQTERYILENSHT